MYTFLGGHPLHLICAKVIAKQRICHNKKILEKSSEIFLNAKVDTRLGPRDLYEIMLVVNNIILCS